MYSNNYHIALVHGTFAKNAPWTKPGSALRKYLVEHVPGRIEFHRFRWSGWPSHLARDNAACRLRAELSERIQNYPTARHCVIAHSHGGNIACYAARDPALAQHLDCIVTLSTPFLVSRHRSLSILGTISLLGTLYLLAMSSFLLTLHWLLGPSTPHEFLSLWRAMAEHPYSHQRMIFVLTLFAFGGLFFGGKELIACWYRWLSTTLSLPELRTDQLFIVRSLADEANALLVFAEFLEIIVTFFWGHHGAFDRLLMRLFDWGEEQLERPWVVGFTNLFQHWAKFSMAWFVVLLPVSWYFYVMRRHEYVAFFLGPYTTTAVVVWACIALIEAPLFLGFVSALLLIIIMLVCGSTIGIVVGIAILSLALIMLVAVPELGPLAMVLAVSTEPSPPGLFRLLQIKPEEGELGAVEALMHSTTYTDPAALGAIAKFIEGKSDAPLQPSGL
jgi:hypothetical protein